MSDDILISSHEICFQMEEGGRHTTINVANLASSKAFQCRKISEATNRLTI